MTTAPALPISTPIPQSDTHARAHRIGLAPMRPRARGKFLFVGDEKFYVRGVTYGTFRPDAQGQEYGSPEKVDRDFARMVGSGVNAVRTYTAPPGWFLDLAQHHGLRVLVGLAWEQHIAFLDDRKTARSIEKRVCAQVRACAGHPAVLAYTVGNEIPAPIVRWHGHRRIERYLERLYRAVKTEDPACLVTYVNYPSTEYLQLGFFDFISFNVYLETQSALEAYLARLQNVADDKPLLIAEIGLDSHRNGPRAQADTLQWQIRSAFASGCAGAFVFAWTDEWHRGGYDIEDWDFGLVDRDRVPKAALEAVSRAFGDVPFPSAMRWPRISVVVCSYNGERTLRDCLDHLVRLEYPNYEVIVVDDGSTDRTASIARQYPVRVISTENMGLSSARNTGWKAASGEIVAYIDDDAYPDPHWLTYLASTFSKTEHAGVGGPNLPPAGDGWIADCVANAPGGPVHVLISDEQAEHIPGCNMAFRKAALLEVGGFDPQFRVAGDDVHLCWLLEQHGHTLGFNSVALVWHHRRNSVRAYWRQQVGYGRAEALLEKRWPEKYNDLGHLTWSGRAYGRGLPQILALRKARIYQGTWGTAPFQSLYQPAPGTVASLSLMPEWYLAIGLLAVATAFGAVWRPLLIAAPLLALAIAVTLIQACLGAARAVFTSRPSSRLGAFRLYALTALLHLLQPLARLWGRLRNGLTMWRRALGAYCPPWPRVLTRWSERWESPEERLCRFEATLRSRGVIFRRGGEYDDWDLEVRGGLFGSARVRMAIEEHGAGKQLIRFSLRPRCSAPAVTPLLSLQGFLATALYDRAWIASAVFAVFTLLLAARAFQECAAAMGILLQAAPDASIDDVVTKVGSTDRLESSGNG